MFNTDIRSDERIYLLKDRQSVDIEALFDGNTAEEVKNGIDILVACHSDSKVKFSASDYGYDGGVYLCLNVYKRETDKEFERRQAILEVQKADAEKRKKKSQEAKIRKQNEEEAKERKLLAELKAKYESN